MAYPTLDQIRAVGDFATTYQWDMRFISVPSIGFATDPEQLNLRVASVTLPKVSIPPIEVQIRGHKVRQPGAADYGGTIPFTAVETVDNVVSNFMREWNQLCWEVNTGVQSAKSEIEATVQIDRLDRQGNILWGYRLFGCWMTDFTLGDMVSDGTGIFMPSFTLAFDYTEDSAD